MRRARPPVPATAILIIDISGIGDAELSRRRLVSETSLRPRAILTIVCLVYQDTTPSNRAHVAPVLLSGIGLFRCSNEVRLRRLPADAWLTHGEDVEGSGFSGGPPT